MRFGGSSCPSGPSTPNSVSGHVPIASLPNSGSHQMTSGPDGRALWAKSDPRAICLTPLLYPNNRMISIIGTDVNALILFVEIINCTVR